MQEQNRSIIDGQTDPLLVFETPIIVLGGGHVDAAALRELVAQGFPIVAADGAANVALDLGLEVYAVVGDMDSYEPSKSPTKPLHHFEVKEQATTDFEKCLYKSEAPLYICLGMMGKRFDHSLAALHTSTKYGLKKSIVFLDETDLIWVASDVVQFEVPIETRVSIYPLLPIQMHHSKGLKYELNGLLMAQGSVSGTSNEASAERVEITPEKGEDVPYLIILPNHYLDRVLSQSGRNVHVSAASI